MIFYGETSSWEVAYIKTIDSFKNDLEEMHLIQRSKASLYLLKQLYLFQVSPKHGGKKSERSVL